MARVVILRRPSVFRHISYVSWHSVIYNRSMLLSLRLLSVVSTCSMLLFVNYRLVYFQLFRVCCYPLVGIH